MNRAICGSGSAVARGADFLLTVIEAPAVLHPIRRSRPEFYRHDIPLGASYCGSRDAWPAEHK